MQEIVTVLANVSVLIFVVSSMLAMGLNLTVKQIVDPLRNIRLVLLALLANFVLVPLAAYVIRLVIPLDEAFGIGLILLATAAGAPFLPKLAQAAKGNIAFSVGLMVLLMVVTVVTGTIHSVTVDLSGELIKDEDAEIRMLMARQ